MILFVHQRKSYVELGRSKCAIYVDGGCDGGTGPGNKFEGELVAD